MINFIKSIILKAKIVRLVNQVCKNTDDENLRLLNIDMMDIEEMYIKYYNCILLTPWYSRSAKKEVLDELRELTDIMNEFRFRNHCMA